MLNKNPQMIIERIKAHLYSEYGKTTSEASTHEMWVATSQAMMELIGPDFAKARKESLKGKRAHYFSAEFLVGRSFVNNLVNLEWYQPFVEATKELGFSLTDLLEEEVDPSLGNGGLGRLAACFMDSCASLNLPVTGYGILYRYGLFRQEFEEGFQKEYPDRWMETRYPFIVRRTEDSILVRYNDMDVHAVPYDLPVIGYHTGGMNYLRLWKAIPAEEFDFNLFNSQRFDDAMVQRNRVQDIYRVLYPNDTSYDGKVLRVRQQYFFISASLQSILRQYVAEFGKDFKGFSNQNVVQLNDTHPVLAIPELIRLLVDVYGVEFEEAFAVARKTFAYTNHTIMQEALEKWDINIFQFLFPRILEIIQEIDRRFQNDARQNGLSNDEIIRLTPIHDGKVHMAWLACYMAFSINGVAAIHTDLLKSDTLNGFYKMWPWKFSNKTNGVTPRRWLRVANQELSGLLTELLESDKWVSDLTLLEGLEKFASDASVMKRFLEIKHLAKERLAAEISMRDGVTIDPSSIFDVQVKRLHEYKRQLMNGIAILDQYFFLKQGGKLAHPVTYLFGGKSAPGYFRAKAIIKFINEVARLVNGDPEMKGKMAVVFMQNYNVSLAEKIFPAANISEQISTVGMEASGTSNMKFMMNGAVTLGTYDGANLEIFEAVGADHTFMFGPKLNDFASTLAYYNPQWQYSNIEGLRRVIDAMSDGTLTDGNTGMFADITNGLLRGSNWQKGDTFYVLGDFDDYRKTRTRAHEAYANNLSFAQSCWVNICRSGRFSSDRTILQYNDEIWHL